MTMAQGASARALASRINASVVREGLSLETVLRQSEMSSPRDSSLVRALCFGALRWHHRLQWQASQLLTKPLKRRDAELAALIRVGLYQLQWLRIPDHAAVAASVGAAECLGRASAKGLVNAVLRRFLREGEELTRRMAGVSEAVTSHPGWMLERLKTEWPAKWRQIIASNNKPPPMWLRVNARRTTTSQYLAALSEAGIAGQCAEEPASAVLLAEPQAMSTLPGFADGHVSVQDAGAQLAAGLLNLKPSMRILDACAAPGGKSAHILESCPEINELVAVDRDADRLAVVDAEFQRLGLTGTLIHGDAAAPAEWWDERPFDRILVDAPCSALGVIRRHPDIKVLRRAEDIGRAAKTQRALLRGLWPLLAPGGRLLYSTCTTSRDENQKQIELFIEEAPAIHRPVATIGSSRQILPGEANMDGFFYAWVEKAE